MNLGVQFVSREALHRPTSSIEAPPARNTPCPPCRNHKVQIWGIAIFKNKNKRTQAIHPRQLARDTPRMLGFGLWGRMAKHSSTAVWQDGMLGSPTQTQGSDGPEGRLDQ